MKHIKKFESINSSDNDVPIKHYQLRQKMEVKGLPRKQGDGKEIIINGIGIIKEIRDMGNDIMYYVNFPISVEYSSPWSDKKWTEKDSTWGILHNKDSKYIIRVF